MLFLGRFHAATLSLRTKTAKTAFTSAATINAGTLAVGNVITIEAFGLFADPVVSVPFATFTLKLGPTTIVAHEI